MLIASFVNLSRISRLLVSSACFKESPNLYRFARGTINRSFSVTRMTGKVKIGTHNEKFHCDEALGCFLLKLLPRYKDAEIVRTRDHSILDTCDIVLDVGGVYDPSKHRYDHHMREFKESFTSVMKKAGYESDVKLSSAGLIYCHFGQEILKLMFPDASDEDIECTFKRVYSTFIKEIDCIDNGLPMHPEEPVYRIRTDLSSRVERLNPSWNDPEPDFDKHFPRAMQLTGEEFTYFVKASVKEWLPARTIAKSAIEKRFEVDPSGEIIELTQFAPWIEHLYSLEKELNISPSIKYCIFPSDTYRIRAVPLSNGNFLLRVPFPEAWAGLRNEKLVEASGVEGAYFVHATKFIGGAHTREAALEMARKSLAIRESSV